MRLVLASTSPRRADLLRAAGFAFDLRPSGVEEWAYPGGEPAGHAEALARAKAGGSRGAEAAEAVFVGADTIVVLDHAVLGKPADPAQAAAMLRMLSGRRHEVVTAVAVRRGDRVACGHARALVTFRPLTERMIVDYVRTGEPMDKAGGYGYQGRGGALVSRLDGDADTVIGLPVRLLRDLLRQI